MILPIFRFCTHLGSTRGLSRRYVNSNPASSHCRPDPVLGLEQWKFRDGRHVGTVGMREQHGSLGAEMVELLHSGPPFYTCPDTSVRDRGVITGWTFLHTESKHLPYFSLWGWFSPLLNVVCISPDLLCSVAGLLLFFFFLFSFFSFLVTTKQRSAKRNDFFFGFTNLAWPQ